MSTCKPIGKLLVFLIILVLWGTFCLATESGYKIKIEGFRPCLDTSAALGVFIAYDYTVAIPEQGISNRAWILIRRNGQAIWIDVDVPSEGLEATFTTKVLGNLNPGVQKIQILLFYEPTPLSMKDYMQGTVPPGWRPKATDSMQVSIGKFAFPRDSEVIWVGTIPVGCDVYVAPREKVIMSEGRINFLALNTYYVGKGPVAVKASPGEYVVAVEVGVSEAQKLTPDENDKSYTLRANGKKVAVGRVYFVTKKWLTLGSVIALFQPAGFTVDQLKWLYPEKNAFPVSSEAITHIINDVHRRGFLSPDRSLVPSIVDLLRRGGKIIWVSSWAGSRQDIIIIYKTNYGYGSHIIRRERK